MKRLFTIVSLFISFVHLTYGQSDLKTCTCPKTDLADSKADTVFKLSNGKSIALCGYRNEESKPVNFSEFVLAVCGQDQIIDFWGATQTCFVKTKKDTLIVETLVNLPVGKNLSFKQVVWGTDRIYFKDQTAVKSYSVNKKTPKYNKANILEVLKEFEAAKGSMDEKKMELTNKLFIAALSSSPTALKYFKQMEFKFGELDGAFAEEYHDLTAMLALWDKQQ